MGNTLKAIITADTSGLRKEVADAIGSTDDLAAAFEDLKKKGVVSVGGIRDAMKQLQGAISTATDPTDIKKLNQALSFLATEEKKLTKTGIDSHLEGLNRSTQRVANSSLGLAKVFDLFPAEISHLTHGFDGLIEAYEQIRSKTETSGQAFGQLAKSFVGPLGIGIALSVGASLLETFGVKLFETSEKAKKAAEKLKELLKPLQDISSEAAAGTAGEAAKVNALIAVIQDQTKSYHERNRALNELKEINKSYFGDLTLETSKLGEVKKAADEYTKALIQQSVIKAFGDEIGKVSVELDKQNRNLVESLKNVDRFKKELSKSNGKINVATGLPVQDPENTIGLQNANKEFIAQDQLVRGLKKQFNDLSAAITDATAQSLTFKPLDDKAAEKSVNKTIELAKKLAAFFDKNTQFSVSFEVDPRDSEEETTKKAKEFIKKTKAFFERNSSEFGVFDFKPIVAVDFKSKFTKESLARFKKETVDETTKTFEQLEKEFESQLKKLGDSRQKAIEDAFKPLTRSEVLERGGSVRINPSFDADNFKKSVELALRDLNEKFITIVGSFQENLFNAVGEGIGSALSGGGFGDIFKGVFNAVGGALQQLGQALIATAIGLKAIKAAFKTLNPGLALGAGVALIALGAIVKNSIGNISGFRAEGGPVQAGKTFVVGEKGPELFTPSIGGRIIPNNQLTGSGRSISSGSNTVSLNGRFVILGKDLVYLLNQVQSSQNRTT